MSSKWAAIVNPNAGSGRCGEQWPKIAGILTSRGIEFEAFHTTCKYQAIELARKAVESGFRRLVAVGGDGTIHEVLNGIMTQTAVPSEQVSLGVIPVGSGNDWIKLYDIPNSYEGAADVLASFNTRLQDVARITTTKDGEPFVRHMVNIGGVGFDAQVCREFDLLKEKGGSGKKLYVTGLLKAFSKPLTRRCSIYADDELFFEGPTFSVAFGIGRFSGGGMMQTPGAMPDDGLISLTVIRKISFFKVLLNLKKLFGGKIYEISQVIHKEVRTLEVRTEPELPCEVDGENVGYTTLRAEIVPLAANVVVK